MRLLALLLAPTALGLTLPLVEEVEHVFEAAAEWLSPADSVSTSPRVDNLDQYLTVMSPSSPSTKGICTLRATPDGQDDTDNIEKTMKRCAKNGIIFMNSARYNITRPLTLHLDNTVWMLGGYLTFSTHNLNEWIKNSYDWEFQNQKLAFIVTGNNFVIDGQGKGGIDGGGQAWYDYAKGYGNKYGRPMSLALKGAKNAVVRGFNIIQPQFWAHVVIESQNVAYDNCVVNATNYNPDADYERMSWLQNTDGIDTYRSSNVAIRNFVYQGGDDCIAFKPNSTNIAVSNVTCIGGTGIAFGSIGQYPGVTDILENIAIDNVRLYPSNQCRGYQGLYFKSWVGVHTGEPPNGGGGGGGWCRNVSVNNTYMENIERPIALTSSLTYLKDEYGKYKDTGTFEWSHINITNVHGTGIANRLVWLDCSARAPCHHWKFENINLTPRKDDIPDIHYVCNNFKGPAGDLKCHPNDSDEETDTGGTM